MYTIRLRRPWERSRIGSDQVDRIDVPELVASAGTADAEYRYRRRFNRPTGLTTASRVYLRISGWSGRLDSITLNGHVLAHAADQVDTDVSDLLQNNNLIELTLCGCTDQPARISGEVMLAID